MSEQRVRAAIASNYRVLRRAVRRLGVAEFELEDVLQETFVVFDRRSSTVEPRAERAFLLQVAFRIVRTRQRSFARRREELAPEFEGFSELRLNPEEEMSQQQSLAVLDRILAEMPLELRMVFNLCELEELPLSAAADVLEVPAGTAASRLRRARELFNKLAARARAASGVK